MPDAVRLLEAMGGAAATAAVVFLLFACPWRATRPMGVAAGWTMSVGLGFAAGCRLLNVPLHWPPREDQDRFLLLVMPAVLGVELLAAVPRVWRGLILSLRIILAAAVAPVLLHGSVYLNDPASADYWPPARRGLILAGMAAALAIVWGLLARLHRRAPGRSLPIALALTCAAAGVTVMLSGYLSGGQLTLPLAASLIGAAAASLVLSAAPNSTGWLGPGIVGLFGVLAMGRFFADLTTAHAFALFSAPLLGWLPELPGFRWLRLSLRGLARVVLIAAAALAVAAQAHEKSSTPVSVSRASISRSSLK
ncbi:MAG TPA: hypothetical protein VH575_09955 [Gemmataceae bacterium]|jgi:hypothetical protein